MARSLCRAAQVSAPAVESSSEGYQITVRDGFVREGKVTRGTLTVEPKGQAVHIVEPLTSATIEVSADAQPAFTCEGGDKLVISVGAAEGTEDAWVLAAHEGTAQASISFQFPGDKVIEVEMFFHKEPRLPTEEDPLVRKMCMGGAEKIEENLRQHLRYTLPIRMWQKDDTSLSLTQTPEEDSFVVYTWNILAEGLSSGPPGEPELKYASTCSAEPCHTGEIKIPFRHSNLAKDHRNDYGAFVVKDTTLLSWDVRKVAIVSEVLTTRPAIICMQEADRYGDWLKPLFASLGYDSLFCPKSEAPPLVTGWYSDGVCLFWKKDEFSLVKSVVGVQAFNNPVVMVGLKDRKDRHMVCVTTHLKASEGQEAENKRLNQIRDLVEKIKVFRTEVDSSPCAVLFCGDFNTDAFTYEKQEALAVPHVLNHAKLQSAYKLPPTKEDLAPHGGHQERPSQYPATTVSQGVA
eukprot:GEMP01043047.1.p1 GENE.GEMP01043047.1~~GEMP01043047.1.p1  ORF type:complete len:462 (+),score=97.02 GEMP01043047.1:128-1513(+)